MNKYFLLSVSTKQNLELCRRYALAGTTNSITGVWAFLELNVGDYVSFLYGARAYDLYRVTRKFAVKNASDIGPWPKIKFRESGLSYYFPFRFELQVLRRFEEPLVRREFAYVAENLLLRGGYRKTHFQADQTTLQEASVMGELHEEPLERFEHNAEAFEPAFARRKEKAKPPESYLFNELVLQSLIKTRLARNEALYSLIKEIAPQLENKELEVLGEKALPQGHLDILIKEAIPIGQSKKIVLEVKNKAGSERDLIQLANYREELGKECVSSVLVAQKFSNRLTEKARARGMRLMNYELDLDRSEIMNYQELEKSLRINLLHE